MKIRNIFLIASAGFLLSSCSLYKKYESKATVPDDVFGSTVALPADTAFNIAQLSWREFFTDPLLQQLIDTALVRNTDLHSARIAVEQCQASLRAARLGYLPSLSFAPSGSLSSFDRSPVSKTYSLPLQLSWDIDVFGSITTAKRKSKVQLMKAQINEESVRANIVSIVAQQYNLLMLLDRELEILLTTDSLWNLSLETQKSLWENGKAYSTAVNQMESSYLNVKTQIVDIRRTILSVENALCRLLALTPQHIQRGRWGEHTLPARIATGAPAALLQYRPDIRIADFALAEGFYNTQAARQAFFPSLNLSGVLGWTNSGGAAIVNPGALLLNAVATLTQPIFQRGKLKANLKIAKLSQEELQHQYVQTVINAGNEVNEAIADVEAAREKDVYYQRQVAVLEKAYAGTHELMDNGKASYLEVITAQESLLSAQLNEMENHYDAVQALIALYIALGGGGE
ncbi:MAG: TolC family protein [Bacteroidaceae bacterium]|nr:TolC family protein [Bacteroidaceae bacterium]